MTKLSDYFISGFSLASDEKATLDQFSIIFGQEAAEALLINAMNYFNQVEIGAEDHWQITYLQVMREIGAYFYFYLISNETKIANYENYKQLKDRVKKVFNPDMDLVVDGLAVMFADL